MDDQRSTSELTVVLPEYAKMASLPSPGTPSSRKKRENPLLLNELLWNKPGLILEQKNEMVQVYSHLLSMLTVEKTAREKFAQEISGNIKKSQDLITNIQKNAKKQEKNEKHEFLMFTELLKVYIGVLEKAHEEINTKIFYLDENLVQPFAKVIKESKSITDRLETSVTLIKKYNKLLEKVDTLKKTTQDSYITYEQGCLVDDLIYKVVQTYGDDYVQTKKDKSKSLQDNYYSKEQDYSNAVVKFNQEMPQIETENVNIYRSYFRTRTCLKHHNIWPDCLNKLKNL